MSNDLMESQPDRQSDTGDPVADSAGTQASDAAGAGTAGWLLTEPQSTTNTPESLDGSAPPPWQTAAQLATPMEGATTADTDSPQASDGVVGADEPPKAEDASQSQDASKPEGSSATTGPDEVIDLTEDTTAQAVAPEEAQAAEDSVRIPASIYRGEDNQEPVHGTVEVDQPVVQPNETVIMPVESALDDHRAARARALGEVDPGADVVAAPRLYGPPSVYKPWPSFTLFILRIVVAAILAISATQEMLNFTQTKNGWAGSILPEPTLMAWVQICLSYLIALMLLLGLASRVAGALLLVLNAGVLTFLIWGASNPFASGVIGFKGELELLMVVIGLVFLGVGGGRAAIDGAVHRARLERKNAKLGGVVPDEFGA
ncbi:MAG: DoxX family membrane protein [Propionibacteriaceae bacterium]|nr:DoxX family membrane protein [Propionibacteriaceae bacterium]